MVRLGAGETGGETIEEDLEDSTSDSDAGSDTSVEDRGQTIVDTGSRDTDVTQPEPVPEPEQPARGGGSADTDTTTDPTPEPQQPARGRGDEGSGTGSGQTIVDTGSRDTDVTQPEPVPEPEQPARGGGSADTDTTTDPTPEPQQPARGRGDEGSGTGSVETGIDAVGDVDDQTAASLNRRISRARGNFQQRREQFQQGQETDFSRDIDAAVGAANTAVAGQRRQRQQRRKEQFGDYNIPIPGTDRDLETELREAGESFSRFSEGVGSALSGGIGQYYKGVLQGEETEDLGALEARLESGERTRAAESFGDFTTGMVEIANVPQVGVSAIELGEYGVYGTQEAFEGDLDTFKEESAQALSERVDATVEYAKANPAEVAGTGAGALVGSAAIMGGASRIGSRAGTVSRFAIQPGEEIAGIAGYRTTQGVGRAIPGVDETRAAERLFPNKEPLFLSEEAAIRGARGVGQRLDNLEYTPASSRFETEFEYTPADARLGSDFPADYTPARSRLGRTRGGATEGTQITQPEELGGAGQDVVDRLYAVDTETETEFEEGSESLLGEFLAEERAQAQLIGRQTGVETESEVRQTEDRVTPNLYQQSVSRQIEAEYETLQNTIDDPDFSYDTETETRRRQAERSEVRSEEESDLPRVETRTETFLDEETFLDDASNVFGDTEVGFDAELGQDVDVRPEFDIEQETELETEFETEQETELETEFETEFEQELETETEFETELEQELEAESETDLEEDLFGKDKDETEVDVFARDFDTGIADVEDLLGGDS